MGKVRINKFKNKSDPMSKIFETEILKCTSYFSENWREKIFNDFFKAAEIYVM